MKESKFKEGEMVVLLDVPKIRERDNSFDGDIGFDDNLLPSIGHMFRVVDVRCFSDFSKGGCKHFVYLLLLSYGVGNIPRLVEENWIDSARDCMDALDAFLDEWRYV